LKNSVLHKKYNFKYNKGLQVTDVNMLSSGICNNINLSQIYNHNNSNSKENTSRNNRALIKNFISFCDLNKNNKIKINPFTSQTNPKSKKNILTKKKIESYKNNNDKNPYEYKSKFRSIFDAKEDV